MLQPDAENLPVEQTEYHRQDQQRAEITDEYPVAQCGPRLGEHTVGKPDEPPAHGAEDHINIGEVFFHRIKSLFAVQ